MPGASRIIIIFKTKVKEPAHTEFYPDFDAQHFLLMDASQE